jgi:hypothetical protein
MTSSVETPTTGYKIQSRLLRWHDISRVVQWKDADFTQRPLPSFNSSQG